jgi:hypothetical protein
LENRLRSQRSEEPYAANLGTLDVDHILPDRWQEHWPLAGEPVTAEDISNAFLASITSDKENPRFQAINRRERLKATLGNLTLVHYGLNRSLQHGPFSEKRERLFAESNLHLNRALMRADSWDDDSIERRGNELFELARHIWRGPDG